MQTRALALFFTVMLIGNAHAQEVQVVASDGKALTASHEDGKGADGATAELSRMAGQRLACSNGRAGIYPCRNVDLLSFLSIPDLGGTTGTQLNDIWGWTDPETGREYALVGRTDGVAFVDVSDPANPLYVGNLPAVEMATSTWRDVKTLGNYALVVMDRSRGVAHGVQVFDLTQLRDVENPPATFTETAHYRGFDSAHNIVVNESTNRAYAVGVVGANAETGCDEGLHIINFSDPLNPKFAGCFRHENTGRHGTGYTHDAQCVIYEGPDQTYRGREICFGANETHVSIADVTDAANPIPISKAGYPNAQYTHQGWLTPDHEYFLLDDELDEFQDTLIGRTRTLIFDVVDLDDPQLLTEYFGVATSIDHNQYVVDERSFQANYTSGLRILDISEITAPVEVGYFDTFPANDRKNFSGAWSNYPFFESGIVVVSSIGEGLFVLEPTGPAHIDIADVELPDAFELLAAYPNPFNPKTTIHLHVNRPQHVRVAAFDVQGREVAVLHDGFIEAAGVREMSFEPFGFASGVYVIRAVGETATESISVTLQK